MGIIRIFYLMRMKMCSWKIEIRMVHGMVTWSVGGFLCMCVCVKKKKKGGRKGKQVSDTFDMDVIMNKILLSCMILNRFEIMLCLFSCFCLKRVIDFYIVFVPWYVLQLSEYSRSVLSSKHFCFVTPDLKTGFSRR